MTLIVSAAAVVGLVIVMGVVMFFISRASKQASNIPFDGPLPDGTKWTLDADVARFNDPDHPEF
jgi:hypothetical protein